MEATSKENHMENLKKKYFMMTPIRHLRAKDFQYLLLENSRDEQDVLFQALFGSKHAHLFKVARRYKKRFLKKLIIELESVGLEVLEPFYDMYLDLFNANDEEDYSYKTYFLNSVNIVIKEAMQMISSGTTGLVSWEAAFTLCEWVNSNREYFKDKAVLELGSGLGLLGLFICKSCLLNSYCFTDYHEQVLDRLHENLRVNDIQLSSSLKDSEDNSSCSVNDKDTSNSTQMDSHHAVKSEVEEICIKNCDCCRNKTGSLCKVRCIKLDWESRECFDWIDEQEIDIVVGSDLVYDSSIIPHLVKVLGHILWSSKERKALIATTIRNHDTQQYFIELLDEYRLRRRVLHPAEHRMFTNDRTSDTEIVEISAM